MVAPRCRNIYCQSARARPATRSITTIWTPPPRCRNHCLQRVLALRDAARSRVSSPVAHANHACRALGARVRCTAHIRRNMHAAVAKVRSRHTHTAIAQACRRRAVRRGSPLVWNSYIPGKPKRVRKPSGDEKNEGGRNSPRPGHRGASTLPTSPAPSPGLPTLIGTPLPPSPALAGRTSSPPVMASQLDAVVAARTQVMQAKVTAAEQRAVLAEDDSKKARSRASYLEAELERMKRERRAGAASARTVMGGARPTLHPILLESLSRRHFEPVAKVTVGDLASAPLLHQDRKYGRPGSTLPGRSAFRFNPPPLPPISAARRPHGVAHPLSLPPTAPLLSTALADVLQTRPINVNLTTADQAVRVGHLAVQTGIQSRPLRADGPTPMRNDAGPDGEDYCYHPIRCLTCALLCCPVLIGVNMWCSRLVSRVNERPSHAHIHLFLRMTL